MPDTAIDPAIESAPRAPHAVLTALGRLLETTLNAAIDLDPETRARLRALDGRALTVTFRHTPLALRIVVAGERLRVGPAGGDSALRVNATPGRLLALALRAGAGGALAPGAVEIAGDAELARRLERIATQFEPDVDAAFARIFGDVAGFQLARGFRRAFAWSRDAAHALARDSADFLTSESRDLVAKPELDSFLDEVDALGEATDRMAARIARLGAGLGKSAA